MKASLFCGFARSQYGGNIARDLTAVHDIFDFRKNEIVRNNKFGAAYLDTYDDLFDPFSYFVMGEYDYFITSLVPDFHFAARYFNQNYLFKAYSKKELTPPQVLLHKYAYFNLIDEVEAVNYAESQIERVIKYPLICIIHIKIETNILYKRGKDIDKFFRKHLKKW